MRNPPLPPLPTPNDPPRRQRITQRLSTDWLDEDRYVDEAETRAAAYRAARYNERYIEDDVPTRELPARAVTTRPVRWEDDMDGPTLGMARVSSPLVTGPLGSGPLGPYPYPDNPASPRRRITSKEWVLLITSISIVVLLVGGITVFSLLKLPSSSNDAAQSSASLNAAPAPTPTATQLPTPTVTPLPAVESSFVSQDAATQGNWQAQYGSQGYIVVGDTQQLPPTVQVTPANQQEAVWQSSVGDPRALQKASDPADPADHVAACWYSPSSFTIDVNVTDGQTHQLALYFVDWDQQNRAEIVNILDPTTDTVLDTRSVTAFTNGEYLVWNVRGHVTIQITNAPGSVNAVVSGVFIAPAAVPGSTPVTSPTDTSTATPISSPSVTPEATPTDTPAA